MPWIKVSRYELDLVTYDLKVSDGNIERLIHAKTADEKQKIIDKAMAANDYPEPRGEEPAEQEDWHCWADDQYNEFDIEDTTA